MAHPNQTPAVFPTIEKSTFYQHFSNLLGINIPTSSPSANIPTAALSTPSLQSSTISTRNYPTTTLLQISLLLQLKWLT